MQWAEFGATAIVAGFFLGGIVTVLGWFYRFLVMVPGMVLGR